MKKIMLELHHFAPSKLLRHSSPVTANDTLERQPEIFYVYSWKNSTPPNAVILPRRIAPESHAAFRSNHQPIGKT